MNRKVFKDCIVLVVGLVCLGALAARFAEESRAAPDITSANQGVTPSYAKNVEIVGNFGGASYAVESDGNHAYLGMGLTMVVLDVTDPVNPAPTGRVILTDNVHDISIDGGYAYLAAGNAGLRLVDVSNPSAPVEVGYYIPESDPLVSTSWLALSVAVSNGYAYVTFDGGSFQVVDVSNPSHPVQVGSYITYGSGRDVALAGNYAYIADGDPGINIIDISDPAHLALIGNYDSTNFDFVNSVVISGTFGYVATLNTITVLDFSDVMTPAQVASYEFSYPDQYVTLAGGYAYVTAMDGIYAFQTSSSGSLIYSGFITMPDPTRIAAAGGHAYVADGFLSLQLIDISVPSAMIAVGSYDMPEFFNSMAVVGNYAYSIDNTGNLWVLNVSDSTWPVKTGHLKITEFSILTDVAVAGNYAYVADNNYGVRIIDISDPANPAEISKLQLPGQSQRIAVAGNYVFVAAALDGLRVVDISDPANPVEVGSYPAQEVDLDVAVEGNYVYIADMISLRILDISDPTQPTEAGYYGMPASRLFISGQVAYVRAYYGSYLVLVDISDPANPTRLSGYYPANGVEDVAVIGKIAYIANSSRRTKQFGVAVVDVSDPLQPTEVGLYKYPKMSSSGYVVPVQEFVYTFGSSGGDDTGVLVLHFTGLSIDGQVEQANRQPAPGVTLSITQALTTTTDLAGGYTFGELARGTYTVTPSLPGFTFWPASHTLTLPPNGIHQDFTLLPLPVSITLTPGLTSTLTLTDTQGLPTTLLFPAGAVTETVTLTFTPIVATEGGSWVFTGHAFELAAYRDGALLPDFAFSLPVTVTIHYSDVDIRLVNDESQLTLWAWVGYHWMDAAQSCEPPTGYQRDEDGNILSLAICRTGRFKQMGPTYPVFLPVVSLPE